ncbi:MAG: methyltransferase domain-containing protein [Patescibacteria group bacterium]|nr:methyltransferase domain-containing protein [Patescibacteria group bacterium]
MFWKKYLERISRFYPSDQSSAVGKVRTMAQIVIIKFFHPFAYPGMNLVPYQKKLKGLKSNRAFVDRYIESKKDFEQLWKAKPRETQAQVESFYHEHDKDVWRQVYLSRYSRHKKKYVLMVTNAVRDFSRDPNLKILDYGCGCGIYGHYLSRRGYRDITFADIPCSTFDFVQAAFGSAFKYITLNQPAPLKETYDVILMIDCLTHAFHPLEATRHVLAHLRPGGLLVIYYEKGVEMTHLARAVEQRAPTMRMIAEQCRCLKDEEVYVKR